MTIARKHPLERIANPENYGACDNSPRSKPYVGEELRHRVHLVVIPASGKGKELSQQVIQPRRFLWKQDRSAFESCGIRRHSIFLCPDRLDRDHRDVISAKLLDQAGP